MTVAELIDRLENMDPEKEVRLAEQPHWPFEYSVYDIAEGDDAVYLAECEQLGYLPSDIRTALEWNN